MGGKDVLSHGFPPIAWPNAHVLILGTLPGDASIAKAEYYGHPRNAFWPIMGELVGASPELPYEARTKKLTEHGIALWDVCKAAHRPGSLDTAINPATVVPNDFAAFLRAHPNIMLICFSSARAAQLYARLVLPSLPPPLRAIHTEILISPSPARALPLEKKLAQWRAILAPALENGLYKPAASR